MSTPHPTAYIIAEAGVNHDGSEDKARALIDIAKRAGADAVKFQLFDPSEIVTEDAPKATYQEKTGSGSQRAMLQKLALPQEAFKRLHAYCQTQGIDFLCTPFDHPSLAYLVANTPMRSLKLASGEVTNGPLLLAAARTQLPIILSTGMSDLQEIGTALSILHFGYTHATGNPAPNAPTPEMLAALKNKVTLLHCVSQYPAPINAVNLRAMATLRDTFGLDVGLSDHALGTSMSVAATALGASVIEKHFTIDKRADGPDHAASLEEAELARMIADIREVSAGLGAATKTCQPEEQNTRSVARRSVVARSAINVGDIFTEANLICKRPNTGALKPNQIWELLGKRAKQSYAADAFIDAAELESSQEAA